MGRRATGRGSPCPWSTAWWVATMRPTMWRRSSSPPMSTPSPSRSRASSRCSRRSASVKSRSRSAAVGPTGAVAPHHPGGGRGLAGPDGAPAGDVVGVWGPFGRGWPAVCRRQRARRGAGGRRDRRRPAAPARAPRLAERPSIGRLDVLVGEVDARTISASPTTSDGRAGERRCPCGRHRGCGPADRGRVRWVWSPPCSASWTSTRARVVAIVCGPEVMMRFAPGPRTPGDRCRRGVGVA